MIVRLAPLPPLEIVAHRGASADAPENTLPAVELAWKQGADAVEIDVQLTRDGRLVAIHDATTERTAGRPGAVRDQTLSDLQQLDAGIWKGPAFVGTRIPTLTEVLDLLPQGKRLFVELKCGLEGIPDLVDSLSGRNDWSGQVVVISFSLPLLRVVRQTMPKIPAYWVCDIRDAVRSESQELSDRLVRMTSRAGLNGLDLSACGGLDMDFVQPIRQAGLHFGVWTVDELPTALRLCRLGVDSLTTNRPHWLRTELEREAANQRY